MYVAILANKVHKQGKTLLLVDKVYKELQCKWLALTQPCRDGCVKQSHLRYGSCLCMHLVNQ